VRDQEKRDAIRAAYLGAGVHPAARPEVGEEIRYSSGAGGYRFLAYVERVVEVASGPTLVIARNIAGRLVSVDLAKLYVDAHGRWTE
jgi:hypothetical protein